MVERLMCHGELIVCGINILLVLTQGILSVHHRRMVEETNITHADLCNLWPSDGELAADLKVAEITESMVTQWRRRNFIPPWWWADFFF